MTRDYLDVEYSQLDKPFTSYPDRLAKHLYTKFNFQPGMKLLEIGAGRCEMASAFKRLVLTVYVIDSSESFEKYAENAKLHYERAQYQSDSDFIFFKKESFDVIFSKSFVEHILDPVDFSSKCKSRLVKGGYLLTLTPDWETNYWNFFDDITHIKPFSKITLRSMYTFTNFKEIEVFTIRQLPSTWKSKTMLALSRLTALVIPTRLRTDIKWLRWSRELMLVGCGRNSG